MTDAVAGAGAATSRPAPQRAPLRALVSWVLFDWSAQPYYTLILTFLFAPYFANVVIGNAKDGTEIWGYATAAAGILIAVGSPLLGALADGRGRRKPWIALFSLLFVASLATLWLATPGASGPAIALVLVAFVVATAAAEFTTVFTNAIMPSLVPAHQLGRLSGTGWAVGYAGGLVSLLLVAGFLVPGPGTGTTLLGLEPLLALDASAHEGDRITGPFAALWYVVFMIPFFIFVPDKGPAPRAAAEGRRSATAELWDTIRSLPLLPDMLLFLLARMIYIDGLAAIFTFGGIYGTSVFGWGPSALAIFGVIVIATGILGALCGGSLDDRFGSKAVIVASLALLIVGALGILSVDKTHVLYSIEVAPKAVGSQPFSSTGELVFLAFAIVVGLVAAPVQAASRALLARLAPPDKVTQFFGLFAFSGKATAFAAPFLVAVVTHQTQSERLGMATIAGFLALGMALMVPVRVRRS